MPSCVITATGSYVPEEILDNRYFESIVSTNDEWIMTRTGIGQRRRARPQESSSDLMLPAAQKALAMAQKSVDELDLIVVSYSFPDQLVPGTSDLFAKKLGAPDELTTNDVVGQCAGFCLALGQTYDKMRLYPEFKTVLVVSGDVTTKFVDYEDRNSCILFGDGAGAVVVERIEEEGYGIMGYTEGSDRKFIDCLGVEAGGTVVPASLETVKARRHFMHFGPEGGGAMLKAIVQKVPELREALGERANLNPAELDLIVPHQLNQRIIDASKKRSNVRVYDRNVFRYGNCSGSSVAMALDDAYREGEIEKGDVLDIESYGAGLRFAAVAVRWWLPKFQGGKET